MPHAGASDILYMGHGTGVARTATRKPIHALFVTLGVLSPDGTCKTSANPSPSSSDNSDDRDNATLRTIAASEGSCKPQESFTHRFNPPPLHGKNSGLQATDCLYFQSNQDHAASSSDPMVALSPALKTSAISGPLT